MDILSKIALYLVALIQFHVLFIVGGRKSSVDATTFGSAISSSTIPNRANKVCPYTATKAFLGKCAYICTGVKIPFLEKVKGARSLTMKQSTQALTFLTAKPITKGVNIAKYSMKSPRLLDTALMASTIDEVQTRVESDKGDSKDEKKPKKKGSTALEVLVLGLSHHNAKVDVREKLAIPEDQWNIASDELCSYPSISEATVLSTCNRFEIYLAGPNQYECIRDALDYLEKRAGGALDQATLR